MFELDSLLVLDTVLAEDIVLVEDMVVVVGSTLVVGVHPLHVGELLGVVQQNMEVVLSDMDLGHQEVGNQG